MQTYSKLHHVRFYGKRHVSAAEREIVFSHEKDNSIDIICGKNRTGKSHILKRIYKCILNHNDKLTRKEKYVAEKISEDDIDLFITDYTKPLGKSLYIDDILTFLKFGNAISVRSDSKLKRMGGFKRTDKGVQYIIKDCLDFFIADVLGKDDRFRFSQEEWNSSDDYREKMYMHYALDKLYKISKEIPIVSKFNEIVGGELYLTTTLSGGKNVSFQVNLVYNEDTFLSFDKWSNGQRVLFITKILIEYYKPKIVLFDEIENHLHPEYISLLFEYLKDNVSQSIISTHHPHIVFSKHVSSVWYLEIEKQNDELPVVLEKLKKTLVKAPVRQVYALDQNVYKLMYTYKLFDSYDTQLLKISSSAMDNINEQLVSIFSKLFQYEVISSKGSKKPDVQSEKIFEHLKYMQRNTERLRVLEIGAGTGRIVDELMKINADFANERIEWVLFEPYNYDELRSKYPTNGYKNIIVIDDLKLLNDPVDIVLFANVLHEIHPNHIAEYFYLLDQILKPQGSVLLVELYPLIYPEKFSIPMTSDEWTLLFRELGLSARKEVINIKNSSIEAFWITASPRGKMELSLNQVQEIIRSHIENVVLRNRCSDYEARMGMMNYTSDLTNLISEFTSIASISSYSLGTWRS